MAAAHLDSPSPARPARGCLRALVRLCLTALVLATVLFAGLIAWLEAGEAPRQARQVHDVTQLIRIPVDGVVTPTTVADLQALLATHDGPISFGGGRYSMGGQIGTDGTLFIDMTGLNRVLHIDLDARTATVEAGIRWRQLIEALDPHDLSVKVMQSYANFTVGGSLSVNAHGRYMGEGPVVHSVRALDLVLADGSLRRCSRSENADLFHAAIGGYGSVGAIARVELSLAPNEPIQRRVERVTRSDFPAWFQRTLRADPSVVMFNADLYPPDYERMVAITFHRTDAAVTVPERLQQGGPPTAIERLMYGWVESGPLGKQARERLIDRIRLASQPVVWRNHEASYDVAGLEPKSRARRTYVLQEYFIPVGNFASFAARMGATFRTHDVNVLNVSVRHAIPDPDTLLTWAPGEVFAFVIYHRMGTTETDWQHAQTWTRELIDAALDEGGTYYLPYQIHATPEQFHQAYPGARELAALKQQLDPDHKLRNRLLDAYLPPPSASRDRDRAIRATLAERPTWARPEDQTFLTLPEWLIVYSTDELGAFLATHRPSAFPWFGAIQQFWGAYRVVWARTRRDYDFNAGYHAMIGVIGTSYTLEYALRGAWEHTLGAWFEGPERVPEEDAFARITADYGAFTHHTPWYAFPFAERRADLSNPPGAGLRGLERRLVNGLDLTLKSWWGGTMGAASQAAYGAETDRIEVWVRGRPEDVEALPGVRVLSTLGPGDLLIELPRYEPFTAALRTLAHAGVPIASIAGGLRVLVQIDAPADWHDAHLWGEVLLELPRLTDPTRKRVAIEVPVRRLHAVIPGLEASAGEPVEHVYDY